MANYIELFIDQGTDFTNVINVTDDLTNASVNVAGYTITSAIKKSYYSANATANITCSISDAANGGITLYMSSNTTANIKAGRYVFDVRSANTTGHVSRLLEGTITILPSVT